MRFPFGRKDKNDESDEEEKKTGGLGIFSPAHRISQDDPLQECKRLAELDRIYIRSKRIKSLEDVPCVVNEVKEGRIMLLDISRLNNGGEQSHLELKRIIERIRGETRGIQANLALVNDDCVIVAPSFVEI